MSAIWENDEVKDKILLLSPDLQESFLRAVDALHSKESSFMLTFIKESRDELRDTHKEIEREQEVLRDTSDLLASKRMYGDLDEIEDNMHEMNAVDDYLKRRNNGEIGTLGILSFEDEVRSHKKAKKKKDKSSDRHRSGRSSRSDALSSRVDTFTAESFGVENEIITDKSSKKEKKDKKDKRGKDEEFDDTGEAPRVKEKRQKREDASIDENDDPQLKEKKHKKEERLIDDDDEPKVKEKKHKDKDKKKNKDKRKDKESVDNEPPSEIVTEKDGEPTEEQKTEEKERKRAEKAERKKLEKQRRKSEENMMENTNALRMEREKSAPVLIVREQSEIERETSELMKEFLTRQSTDVEERNNFEEAMKRKLAKKKNPHAAEADKLMQQQAWAEEAIDREKAAYEAKMMEKLKSRREKSGLVSREMSSLDEPGSTSEPIEEKPKKEKKKKKNKDKDREEDDDDEGHEKQKKKKKKKDKDKDQDAED